MSEAFFRGLRSCLPQFFVRFWATPLWTAPGITSGSLHAFTVVARPCSDFYLRCSGQVRALFTRLRRQLFRNQGDLGAPICGSTVTQWERLPLPLACQAVGAFFAVALPPFSRRQNSEGAQKFMRSCPKKSTSRKFLRFCPKSAIRPENFLNFKNTPTPQNRLRKG